MNSRREHTTWFTDEYLREAKNIGGRGDIAGIVKVTALTSYNTMHDRHLSKEISNMYTNNGSDEVINLQIYSLQITFSLLKDLYSPRGLGTSERTAIEERE